MVLCTSPSRARPQLYDLDGKHHSYESCKSTEASEKHWTWRLALARPNWAWWEAKNCRPSPARSANAVNMTRRIERVQIEKPEFPKLGGATGSLAHSQLGLIRRESKHPKRNVLEEQYTNINISACSAGNPKFVECELRSSSWVSLSGVICQWTAQMWVRGKTDLSYQ